VLPQCAILQIIRKHLIYNLQESDGNVLIEMLRFQESLESLTESLLTLFLY